MLGSCGHKMKKEKSKMKNKAAAGMGSLREKRPGLWEYRIFTGRNPATGKPMQKSIYGNTQAEAVKKAKAYMHDIDNGALVAPAKVTVAAWLDTWVKDYTSNLKPRTVALYKGCIENNIKPALGAVKLQSLNRAQVQAFINGLQVSPKTTKNIHGVLSVALSRAVTLDLLRLNPAHDVVLPRVQKPQLEVLEYAKLQEFLQAIGGHRLEYLFITTLFTGLRQAEVIGLTWDCVNFENQTVHVYRQLQIINKVYMFTSLKNDKPRTITVAQYVVDILALQKSRQEDWQRKAGVAWDNKEDFVFSNELGKHITQTMVYKDFKAVTASIGLPALRFHDLRHSFAVISLHSGDDIKTVQDNLGHHAASFTLEKYAHATERMKKDSAARMDTFIKTIKDS